jgi:glyoxylase-like metal-dependent hydrolase (beta-lactamase superfamily II)
VPADEIAPGLRRWTTRHEEWKEDVASLAVDTGDGLALIDPLDPPRELGKAEHVLLTVFFHLRSTKEVGAKRVWAPHYSVRSAANRGVEVTDVVSPDEDLPGGIRAFQTPRRSEVVYWLPEHRSVVVGDVLLGAGAKPKATDDPLRLCPERWLGGGPTHADLRESLAPLLELPVERVLVAHGEPVLQDGRRELERVLA